MYKSNNKVTSKLLQDAKVLSIVTSFVEVNSDDHKSMFKLVLDRIRERAVLRMEKVAR